MSESWERAGDDQPSWSAERERVVDGWHVALKWWGDGATAVRGPRQIVITATDGLSPVEVRRGVSPSVLRHVAPAVTQMAEEFNGDLDQDEDRKRFEDAVRGRVAKLPGGGPRQDPDLYYSTLLALFEELAVISTEPHADIARAMGIPKNTVRTQVRVARNRRELGVKGQA